MLIQIVKKLIVVMSIYLISMWFQVMGWAEQGLMFFIIDMGISFICFVPYLVMEITFISSFSKTGQNLFKFATQSSLVKNLRESLFLMVLNLFITWLSSEMFGISFFVAFQIMAIASCFNIIPICGRSYTNAKEKKLF